MWNIVKNCRYYNLEMLTFEKHNIGMESEKAGQYTSGTKRQFFFIES
jgi:hypothetical protein